jgi:acetylornithine deacetylase/succinyl-diaminopimelate desuccinylase-like protein
MFGALATELRLPIGSLLRQLLNPMLTGRVLDLLGTRSQAFDPLLHNTVSATIIRGGDNINVIPGAISVELDGRLLPGYTPDDMPSELRSLLGDEVEFEVLRYDPGPTMQDMEPFDTLAGILREADPAGIPVPMLLGAITDGRFFALLGIQTYGFLPIQLPEDFNFGQTIHAANERIPVVSLDFGCNAVYKVLQRFGS